MLFASKVKELGVDPARVNVNGGSIALGHPIGKDSISCCMDSDHCIGHHPLHQFIVDHQVQVDVVYLSPWFMRCGVSEHLVAWPASALEEGWASPCASKCDQDQDQDHGLN